MPSGKDHLFSLATLILGEEYDANFGDAAYAFLLSAAFAGVTSLGSYRGGRAKIIDAALAEVDSYHSPDGMDYFDRCYTTRDIMARYERLSQDLDIDVPEVERQRSIRQGVIEGMTAGITAKENANAVSAAVETAVRDYETIRRSLPHENSEISTNYDVQTETGYGTIEVAEIDQFIANAQETFQKLRSLTLGKRTDDHAGHLIADWFGGSPELDNLVSQAKNVNWGEYSALEKQWAAALQEGKQVSVEIKINYDSESPRPTSFEVTYWIDGKQGYQSIEND